MDELEDIILSELRQKEKDKYCASLICGIKNIYIQRSSEYDKKKQEFPLWLSSNEPD